MDNWQLSKDTDVKDKRKKTQQQQKPTKVDIKTSYKDSMRFEVYPPIRMKRGGAEWMEYMIDGSASRTNKLATIDNYSNDAFKEISSSNNFADIATNKHEEPNLKPKLSNEKVKIELAREFIQDPQFYTTALINNLVERLHKKYSLSDKQIDVLKDKSKQGERLKIIESLREYQNDADDEFISTIKTINILLENLQKAENFKEGSLSKTISKNFKDEIEKRVFSSEVFDFEKIDLQTKEILVGFGLII